MTRQPRIVKPTSITAMRNRKGKLMARQSKDVRKSSPVETAWLKFVDKFQAFEKMPDHEKDKETHKAWERALNVTDTAAYAVIAQRATCLRDMELKIQAWAFTSEATTSDLASLADWQPHECAPNSELIASLRDDILAIKRLVWGANIALGSIASGPPPMPDMPVATPYPLN
jgi:hypothetical protein